MSTVSKSAQAHDVSRRGFVQRALYVAPAVLTLSAAPAYVKAGSVKAEDGELGWNGSNHPDHPIHPDHPVHPTHPDHPLHP